MWGPFLSPSLPDNLLSGRLLNLRVTYRVRFPLLYCLHEGCFLSELPYLSQDQEAAVAVSVWLSVWSSAATQMSFVAIEVLSSGQEPLEEYCGSSC